MGSKRCSIIEESENQAFQFFMTGGKYSKADTSRSLEIKFESASRNIE